MRIRGPRPGTHLHLAMGHQFGAELMCVFCLKPYRLVAGVCCEPASEKAKEAVRAKQAQIARARLGCSRQKESLD